MAEQRPTQNPTPEERDAMARELMASRREENQQATSTAIRQAIAFLVVVGLGVLLWWLQSGGE